MADVVDTLVLQTGSKRTYCARFTNVSDGTGEAAVVKVDLSALIGPNGRAPLSTSVMEMRWNIQGFTSVRLFWAHTTPDEITVLSGNGYVDYTDFGGLADPRTAGGTGNITITTAGAAAGATYDISLVLELKDN